MTSKQTYEKRLEMKFDYYQRLYKHKYGAFLRYKELLEELSNLLKDSEKIIIRPHPSEQIEDWHNITKKLKNIYVVRDGDISPWILAADGVLQYGSTTATQAALNGISPIQYKIEWVEGITDTPSFELCVDTNSATEVYHELSNRNFTTDPEIQNKAVEYLKNEMAFDEFELSAVKISKILDQNCSSVSSIYKPNYYSKILPILKDVLDYGRSIFLKVSKQKMRYQHANEQMSGKIKASEVEEIISSFKESEGCEANIQCKGITKNLVSVELIED